MEHGHQKTWEVVLKTFNGMQAPVFTIEFVEFTAHGMKGWRKDVITFVPYSNIEWATHAPNE